MVSSPDQQAPRMAPARKTFDAWAALLIVSPALFAGLVVYAAANLSTISTYDLGYTPAEKTSAEMLLNSARTYWAAEVRKVKEGDLEQRDALEKLRTREAAALLALEQAQKEGDARRLELRTVGDSTSPEGLWAATRRKITQLWQEQEVRDAAAATAKSAEAVEKLQKQLAESQKQIESMRAARLRVESELAAVSRSPDRMSDAEVRRQLEAIAKAQEASRDKGVEWGTVIAAFVTGMFGVFTTWLANGRNDETA